MAPAVIVKFPHSYGRNLVASHPCDTCNFRVFCATGSDCLGYRKFTDGASLKTAMRLRGKELRLIIVTRITKL